MLPAASCQTPPDTITLLHERIMNIFWSWQSDTPAVTGRDFVKSALADAVAMMVEELDLSEADRPTLDHDTKGVPGLAPIADTIFNKIDNAAIFVADITLTGATPDGRKRTPNPNVLIELGYALKALGPERIVLVANRADGFRPEDLPFDLRHRRGPITYDLGSGIKTDAKERTRQGLAKDLASALRSNLGSFVTGPAVDPPQYPSIESDRSIWFDPSQPIPLHDSVIGRLHAESPRAYLRISAADWKPKKPTRLDIRDRSISPFGEWRTGSSTVPNELGVLVGGWHGNESDVTALAQWFDKTAEIWGVSTAYGRERDGRRYLPTIALAREWRTRLREWIILFEQLGAQKPFRVEAGLTGAKGLEWPNDLNRSKCMDSEVALVHRDRDWSEDAQVRFLTEVFGRICDSFAIHRLGLQQVSEMAAG